MKFLLLLILFFLNLDAVIIKSYKTNTFFDLERVKLKDIKGIKEPSIGCVLFKDNTQLYCVLKEQKQIKIYVIDKNDKEIEIVIINAKYLVNNNYYKTPLLDKKFQLCVKDTKKLKSKTLVLINDISNLNKKYQDLSVKENTCSKNLTSLIIKSKKKKIHNENLVLNIKQNCIKERTELLSIMRGKKYKNTSEYSIENQLLFELEDARKQIKKLQHDYLEVLKETEKLRKEKKHIQTHSINGSGFFE
jgi:hypothetical protein